MNKKHLENLSFFGLTEKESSIYLALLEMGASSVLQISRATQINRSTIYPILESLNNKGLVKVIIQGLKKLYAAIDPVQLKTMWNKQSVAIDAMLSNLQNLYADSEEQNTVELYTGLDSVKSIYERILTEIQMDESYYIISNQADWLNLDESYFLDFIKRRSRRSIDIKLICTDSEIARQHTKKQKFFNQQVKILPSHITLQSNVVITPQNLCFHQLVAPLKGILIKNKYVIQTQMRMFELLWECI